MWQNVSLQPLPENSFHLVSLSSFLCWCLLCIHPHSVNLKKNKKTCDCCNQLKKKKTAKSKTKPYLWAKRCSLHTQVFHWTPSGCSLNTSIPNALLCLFSTFPICFIYYKHQVIFFPLWVTGQERWTRTSCSNVINIHKKPPQLFENAVYYCE